MPRLRNAAGVVVSVSDETAATLGSEWKSVEQESSRPPAKKSAPAKRASSAKSDN